MTDIESLGHELVYKSATVAPSSDKPVNIRGQFRALVGMQKEALVSNSTTGLTWRMVCDEGPYLNGTDLAPFPLAFYTSGMAFSFANELLKHAKADGIKINNLCLTQDNKYTMQGSAIRGDMIGGALPVEMRVEVDSDASTEQLAKLLFKAEQTSSAQRYPNNEMGNRFGLSHNGKETAVSDMLPLNNLPPEPTPALDASAPIDADSHERNLIEKTKGVETVFGVEGGAGSSLQATQKRMLHVRGMVTLRDDGLLQCDVQLFKPLGSNFRFICDESGGNRAPTSLDYLSAGVGFCFMTQIGRYAHITKQALHTYSVVQDTAFETGAESSVAHPIDTYTYLASDESDEIAQKTLWMSERTCFLHAAMRGSTQTKMTLAKFED